MAKTFTLTSGSYQGRYMQVYCTQTIDIANNTSKIDWTLSSIGGSSNYYSTGATTLTINGTDVYYKARVNWDEKVFPAAKGSVSGTMYVTHDEKGDQSITVSLSTAIYEGTIRTYSDRWYLDNIPRQAYITSSPNVFESNGEPPTIEYSNPAGDNVTILELCIADSRAYDIYVPYRNLKKNETSYKFTADDMEALKLKAGNKLDVTFVLRTNINGTYLWSIKPSVFEMKTDDTTLPSVTMTIDLNNDNLPSNFKDMCIQGKSRLNIDLTAQGKYGASIDSYAASVDGKRYFSSSFTTDVIMNSGSVFVFGYATDSRGFVGQKNQRISVLEYSKPLIVPIDNYTPIQCYRSDGNGNKIGNSTSVWIKAKRSYYALSNKNTCALEWRRKSITEAWDDNKHKWHKLIAKTDTSTDEYDALITDESDDDVFEVTSSYVVQIRAKDDIGEYDTEEFDIPTQEVTLHLGAGGKKASFGKYSNDLPDYTLYSDWKAIFDKGVYIGENRYPISDFVIEQGTSGIWTYEKWASGKAVCWGVTNTEAFAITTVYQSLYYSEPTNSGKMGNAVFPKNLFCEAPTKVNIQNYATAGLIGCHIRDVSEIEVNFFVSNPILTTLSLQFTVEATGKWKQ